VVLRHQIRLSTYVDKGSTYLNKNSKVTNEKTQDFIVSEKILLNKLFIPCIPLLAKRLNSRIGAMFLQQLHYWQTQKYGKLQDNKRWIFNTYESWAEQLSCSVSNVRKIVSKLETLELIETHIEWAKRGKNYLRKWYTINYLSLNLLYQAIDMPSLNKKENKNINKKTLPSENFSSLKIIGNNCDIIPVKSIGNLSFELPLSSRSNNKDNKIINNLSPTEVESNYQKMITIWNELVHQGSQTVKLTERRIKWLKRRFRLEFQSCLEKWKAYCLMIAENDFLMGMGKKGWKATLDWAILPHNIQKVLSNAYQHLIRKKKDDPQAKEGSEKPLRSQADIEAETQEAIKKIETSFHPLFWKEVSKKLILTLGPRKFESWISQLIPDLSQGNEVILTAPSRFIADWVEKNYSETILSTCQKLDKKVHKLEFRSGDRTPQANGVPQENNQQETQKIARFIEGSHHPGFWKEVCKHLLSKLGVGKFKSWIPQLSLQDQYQDTLVLKAASQGSLVWLKRNFADSILECCQKLDPKIRYLEFTCE